MTGRRQGVSDSGPDYAAYTLAQLRDVQVHVDREKYPERARQVDGLIADRLARGEEPALRSPEALAIPDRSTTFIMVGLAGAALASELAGLAPRPLWARSVHVLVDTAVFLTALTGSRAWLVAWRTFCGLMVVSGVLGITGATMQGDFSAVRFATHLLNVAIGLALYWFAVTRRRTP